MPARLTLAAVGAAVLAFGSACGAASGPSAEEQAQQQQQEAQQRAADVRATARLRQNYAFNFSSSGAYWYVPASRLTVSGDTIAARTGWYYGDAGKQVAAALCNVLRGNYTLAGGYGATDVLVYSGNDLILAHSFQQGDCDAG